MAEPGPTPAKAILNLQETADFLGVPLSAIYKLTAKRAIPYFKIGRRIRFFRARLVEWAESRQIEPADQGEDEVGSNGAEPPVRLTAG